MWIVSQVATPLDSTVILLQSYTLTYATGGMLVRVVVSDSHFSEVPVCMHEGRCTYVRRVYVHKKGLHITLYVFNDSSIRALIS